MSIILGARGFAYFVHNFDKNGKYVTGNGLLADAEAPPVIGHD